jgi:hypothetical protein
MRRVWLASLATSVASLAVFLVPVAGQSPGNRTGAATNTLAQTLKTAWGEPDLQGIWGDVYQTPLQRPAKYAGKEFFTDAEIGELDRQRAAITRRDFRGERGTEGDVGGAYNAFWMSVRHTGRRTSLVVDPPDGRIPPLTEQAQQQNAVQRAFQAALLQSTNACKNNAVLCRGGKYDPKLSPRRAEPAPYYNTGRLPNRADGPEDRSLMERCMGAALPDFSTDMSWGVRQIVQSPGSVSIFYDVGQGQGWERIIPVDGHPHLPASIRQWWGDSRGRWEGNTLIVDVTNFSPKSDFQGAHENLHLVERFTRVDPTTLNYDVRIEDPTIWTKPWTVKQELTKQDAYANRIYMEPRCHEGNYGLAGMLIGARAQEHAFAEGTGPDPATLGGEPEALGGEENRDGLQ